VLEGFFPTRPNAIVVAAGRLSPEKGFDVLIDAAAQVVKDHPNAGFLLFGDGPLRETLSRRIEDRGLTGRFVLGGFRTDLERLVWAADLAALSSHTEGLPVVLLEALASGLPAVATAVGGVPEVIRDGRDGFLVPPANPPALAQKIKVLLADQSLRRAMGAEGRGRVREEFSFSRSARLYADLFERLTGGRGAPAREAPRERAGVSS
jgi:glycosyltransferase involved in cell wall biosynthesis